MKSIKGHSGTTIEFANRFTNQLNRAPDEIKAAFREILPLFAANPHHPTPRNHPLQRKLAGYHSIDVTGDWRAVYRETQSGTHTTIVLYQIGTHPTLYKSAGRDG